MYVWTIIKIKISRKKYLMPEKNIVIDNGSGTIKAGFAGEE
jgi:actin-related protein